MFLYTHNGKFTVIDRSAYHQTRHCNLTTMDIKERVRSWYTQDGYPFIIQMTELSSPFMQHHSLTQTPKRNQQHVITDNFAPDLFIVRSDMLIETLIGLTTKSTVKKRIVHRDIAGKLTKDFRWMFNGFPEAASIPFMRAVVDGGNDGELFDAALLGLFGLKYASSKYNVMQIETAKLIEHVTALSKLDSIDKRDELVDGFVKQWGFTSVTAHQKTVNLTMDTIPTFTFSETKKFGKINPLNPE